VLAENADFQTWSSVLDMGIRGLGGGEKNAYAGAKVQSERM
jgi:hypothetical protein